MHITCYHMQLFLMCVYMHTGLATYALLWGDQAIPMIVLQPLGHVRPAPTGQPWHSPPGGHSNPMSVFMQVSLRLFE